MQNVYDIAHDLARSLKETDQFKDYAKLKKQVDSNEQLKKMIDDFQTKSMEMQAKMMSGEEQDKDLAAQLQSLYGIVMSDPSAAAYMQSQMALSQIISDIYQIIGEAVNV
ncbi:MAG: YlbF family regulator [Firmicutes bacterium]|nr:YlbF family regulator [Bacillota bacterium]